MLELGRWAVVAATPAFARRMYGRDMQMRQEYEMRDLQKC